MPHASYEIAFLPEPWEFHGKHFSLTPIKDYDQRKEQLLSLCVNGKILPPSESMQKLFASHILTVNSTHEKSPKLGSAAFVVHLLGFLAGTRMQFADWWFDGPVPFKNVHGISIYKPNIVHLVDRSLTTYRSIKGSTKRRAFINALYFQNKAQTMRFEWERFMLYFFALEALLSAANCKDCKRGLPAKWRRSQIMRKLNAVSFRYGIHFKRIGEPNTKRVRRRSTQRTLWEIKNLRNRLVHEATWHTVTPGAAAKDSFPYYAGWYLRDLNARIIVALIIGRNNFSSSDWTTLTGNPRVRV